MRTILKERLRSAFELVLDRIVEDVLKKCLECGAKTDHFHHPVPKVLGGVTTIPVCHECHGLIHGMDFTEHSELTKAGMRKAAEEGRILIHGDEMYEKIFDLFRNGLSNRKIRQRLGVGTSLIQKAKIRFKELNHVVSANQEVSETAHSEGDSLGDQILESAKDGPR